MPILVRRLDERHIRVQDQGCCKSPVTLPVIKVATGCWDLFRASHSATPMFVPG
ncbi:Copine family protein 1, partial [Clarias magur]